MTVALRRFLETTAHFPTQGGEGNPPATHGEPIVEAQACPCRVCADSVTGADR